MTTRWMPLVVAFTAALFAANVSAQAPAAPGGAAAPLSAAQLDALVGRIALYPDDLVALILPASTSPLQMVQAERYLEKRKADPKAPLNDSWDDPVKTLLNYPEIVKMMSGDLDWTSDLGEAVVADQGAVLEAVQVFRRKAQSTGNLKTDNRQTVVVEKEVIKIVPADPQVVYVPQYNPATVVVAGSPYWGYYGTPYPSYYYPYAPGAALATGLIWGAAIGAAWSGGRWGASYSGGGNTINIDNSVNRSGGGRASTQPASAGGKWNSGKQPGQVSGSTGRTQSARVGDTSRGGNDRGGGDRGGGDRGGGDRGGGARASTQPSGGIGGGDRGGGDRGGGSFGGGDRGGSGAFGGASSSGRQTQMDSSRGASSRGGSSFSGSPGRSDTMSGMSGRTGRSGASMGGGGGGGRGGGGGGGRGGGGRR